MVALSVTLAWWGERVRRRHREEQATEFLTAVNASDHDPVALIRAVNHLQSMGKADAIAAMRRFAPHGYHRSTEDRHRQLEPVIMLLFDRADPEDGYPQSGTGQGARMILKPGPWPRNITVQDDFPFQIEVGRSADETAYLLEWAETRGRMRESPLSPAGDPLAAADKLIDGTPESSWNNMARRMLIIRSREQAYRAIKHLLPPAAQEELKPPFFSKSQWNALKERCGELDIQWSELKQEYVATKGASG
jgi:hypothetical protein